MNIEVFFAETCDEIRVNLREKFLQGFAIKIFLLCTLIIFSAGRIFSQTVEYSAPDEGNEKTPYATVLSQTPNGLYILRQNYRQRRRNIVIEKFSPDLKAHQSKEFLTKKDEFLLQIIVRNNE